MAWPWKAALALVAGAVMVVVGIVQHDLTMMAIGAGFIGIPGLSQQATHTVVVLRNGNGNGKGSHGTPEVG